MTLPLHRARRITFTRYPAQLRLAFTACVASLLGLSPALWAEEAGPVQDTGQMALLGHNDTFGFETSLRLDTLAAAAPSTARTGLEHNASRARKDTADDARYRARENASAEAQEYRGGDTLIIGATTATIILAVILLVILL